ncbi:hypothetical protein CUZ96_1390 [Enterococcus lactis]|nr:hypothetical protein [Enterococcus faecium]MBL4990268.1 hypothetical protein [Enterococcus lactis]MBL4992852.1 hypothetical protein [Enterococcus lactis]MBL5011726.1 hypothetical protein [Enterococcus lactis]
MFIYPSCLETVWIREQLPEVMFVSKEERSLSVNLSQSLP